MVDLLKLEITCRNHLTISENTIFYRMVSVIGSVFQCRIDAFDNTLSCYSDRIAENYVNTPKNNKLLNEKPIVSSGDYSPKTA